MIGAGVAAAASGALRASSGDYTVVWLLAGAGGDRGSGHVGPAPDRAGRGQPA
jgi:hypothetical protein